MEHRIGLHNLRIEGDLVFITLNGDCVPDQIRRLLSVIDEAGGGRGNVYVLADVRNFGSASAESRRIAVEWTGVGRINGAAILGATLITRAMVVLVWRASTILSKSNKITELHFCKSEEEGRAWLAARRTAAVASSSTLRTPSE
jgi:hypothetical protein